MPGSAGLPGLNGLTGRKVNMQIHSCFHSTAFQEIHALIFSIFIKSQGDKGVGGTNGADGDPGEKGDKVCKFNVTLHWIRI